MKKWKKRLAAMVMASAVLVMSCMTAFAFSGRCPNCGSGDLMSTLISEQQTDETKWENSRLLHLYELVVEFKCFDCRYVWDEMDYAWK